MQRREDIRLKNLMWHEYKSIYNFQENDEHDTDEIVNKDHATSNLRALVK